MSTDDDGISGMHNAPARRAGDLVGLGEIRQNLHYLERRLSEALSSRDHALTVALASLEKRLDSMNEFRGTLQDQASRFLTRSEWQSVGIARDRDVEDLKLAVSNQRVLTEQNDKQAVHERDSLNSRLDSMNEFRAQLKDQAGTFMLRNEADIHSMAVQSTLRRLELSEIEKISRSEMAVLSDGIDRRLKIVEGKLANWDGRVWMFGAMFTGANIFISWLLSVTGSWHHP